MRRRGRGGDEKIGGVYAGLRVSSFCCSIFFCFKMVFLVSSLVLKLFVSPVFGDAWKFLGNLPYVEGLALISLNAVLLS